jgi:hypothetical protein
MVERRGILIPVPTSLKNQLSPVHRAYYNV